jgi:hypothetical protein
MDHSTVREQASALVKLAEEKAKAGSPVDDQNWFSLIEIGMWARGHSKFPDYVAKSVPKPDEPRSWPIVEASARAVLKAYGD